MSIMTAEQFDCESSYRAALSILKDWQNKGLVTDKEYVKIDTMLARKFSPVWGGIPPLKQPKRPDNA